VNSSTVPAPSDSSGAAEFGFTVMIGVPLVTLAVTVKLPANTLCVVTGPSCTSTASVIRPESSLMASLPAISLPSTVEGIRIAPADDFSASCWRASALGATR
jgi:hypothetical protein